MTRQGRTVRMSNNGGTNGLVTTTAGPDLVHTLSAGQNGVSRSARLKKIMATNATGATVTLSFGTRNSAAVPAYVQLTPNFYLLNGIDTEITEEEIPGVEFRVNPGALAAGREGNIWCQASAVGVVLIAEVEEIGG